MEIELKLDPIILCGGLGTRIQSKSKGLPKSLMPVGDKVFLDYVFESLNKYQIKKTILSLHYRPDEFLSYIDQNHFSFEIIPVVEPSAMDTGGAIKYIFDNTPISDPFFVLNGDTLSNTNLDLMKAAFEMSDYDAIIGISYVNNASRYGKVKFNGDCLIEFSEKTSSSSGWINNGHYIFKKKAFNGLSGKFSLERDIFPKLVKKNKLGVFQVVNDSFIDMGLPEDYEKLCKLFEASK